MEKNKYSATKLIEDLRREIFKIIPTSFFINNLKVKMIRNGILSDKKLSLILCGYEGRLKRIKRNIRANPDFKIAQDELMDWSNSINDYFGSKSDKIINFIKQYRELNENLPISRKKGLKVLNYHPKLKLDFFEIINTKEKAYWLGLIWAEIYLGKRGEISLELNNKDEILIDRYCKTLGLNPKYKKYQVKMRKKSPRTYVRIRFKSSKIQKDLYKLGYIKSSKKSTIFPKLDIRELDLAFLLGFFDGDGKEGTNTLHIGSRKILEHIKEKFNVPHEILPDKKGYYYFSLGGKLFNEMMTNYRNSLERKRRFFRVPIKEKLKELISREKLRELVWKLTLKEIAERYNAYPRAISELCIEWGIKRPPTHYWHQNLSEQK
ncbi:MAG: hypothetical protein EU529_12940 [Promethearchaeota archaeon]|nr:MAG: hypothetical protein EU529_12940 [Candidatus Lokiarchaeota archaeon]